MGRRSSSRRPVTPRHRDDGRERPPRWATKTSISSRARSERCVRAYLGGRPSWAALGSARFRSADLKSEVLHSTSDRGPAARTRPRTRLWAPYSWRVFSGEDRERLRDQLIAAAQADARISAAALLGSSAIGPEDKWSDIDFAVCVDEDPNRKAVIVQWTDRMYAEHGAVHHLDVPAGETLYRVFLLANTLQVDLSFWPTSAFRATGPAFRLLFGDAVSTTATAALASAVNPAWS